MCGWGQPKKKVGNFGRKVAIQVMITIVLNKKIHKKD
jgi:hypothetical protein